MKECSIIIPTHNRPKLLLRAIKYYEENIFKDFKIIIVDSSNKKFKYHFKKNFIYTHLKNKKFCSKILIAIKKSKTKFTIMCNDDDFISCSGLKKGISFLKKNKKYSAFQGEFISFRKLEKLNLIIFIEAYFDTLKYNLNFNQKKKIERINLIYLNRPHWYNALHYRSNLEKSFSIAEKGSNQHFSEIMIPLIIGSKGYVKTSNLFWYAKDSNVYKSMEIVAQNRQIKMLKDILNEKKIIRRLINQFFKSEFKKSYKRNIIKYNNIITNYFKKYLLESKKNFDEPKLLRIKTKLRKITPLRIKNFLRVIINLIKNHSLENSCKSKTYGPIKNPYDWNLMKKHIYYFDKIHDYKSIYKNLK